MLALLEAGPEALLTAAAALDGAARLPLADVRLEALIARPPKFLAVSRILKNPPRHGTNGGGE